ncbi:MAG: hypothetical protein FWH40_06755 [Coriobacteriia bacterium]|nr:hypothetical protein [Coriobacteriia bacterium]
MKRILSVFMALAIVFSLVEPAFAAQKISNPDTRGGVDGIDYDPATGIHNSYAWCSVVFQQTESDYLWVGMNRDLGAFLLGAANPDLSLTLFGMPDASMDKAGRIYRQRVSDNEAEWELVYQNDGISGYRKMIVFNGDLYVLAGTSNRRSVSNDYSIVLRFSKDYQTGDQPEIVFWENVTGTTTEYFRSATILDGKLYIGTFDGKIWVTDGSGLTNLTPNSGPKDTGWDFALELSNEAFDVISGGAIWDLLTYNESIYAFVANVGDAYAPAQAFAIYKIKPTAGGYQLKQIVGDETALYPYGLGVSINSLGISRNMTASGFIYNDYVYVSTFANGPVFLGALAQGNYQQAFNNIFCPAQIYRFDKDDNWEVVVGDEYGDLAAYDNQGNQIPRISDPSQRAGFFLQGYDCQNVSFNQYVWWMTEHEGKLYASTWDMGVFKQYYGFMSLYIFNGITDNLLFDLLGDVTAIEDQVKAILSDYQAVNLQQLAEELGAYLQAMKAKDHDDCDQCLDEIVDGYTAILASYFPLADVYALSGLIFNLATEALSASLDPCQVVADTLAFVSTTALYFIDTSNPAGFDLFVSEDGINFQPVTVDGFGDASNYGGRVLVSSDHGLYVTTANPFNGGQVWRLSPIEPDLYPNGPTEAWLGEADEACLTVLVTDMPAGTDLLLDYTSDIVDIALIKRETSKVVADITWDNQVLTLPGTNLKYYSVTEATTSHETVMYDVVISPVASGQEDIVLSFSIGSKTAVRTISVTVDLPEAPVSDADFLRERAAGILENGLSSDNLRLEGKTLTLVIDGREFVLSTNANNVNIEGEISLGDGYYLRFDLKGNGSNVKAFEVYQK